MLLELRAAVRVSGRGRRARQLLPGLGAGKHNRVPFRSKTGGGGISLFICWWCLGFLVGFLKLFCLLEGKVCNGEVCEMAVDGQNHYGVDKPTGDGV